MGNLNINRNSHDTGDNVRYVGGSKATDYRGIALLIGVVFAGIVIIWLLALLFTGAKCYFNNNYTCDAQNNIFTIFLIAISIFAVIGVAIALYSGVERVRNQPFIEWRGVPTHRADLRDKETIARIIAVAMQSAKSEGTAGMDTYSPSINNAPKSDKVDEPDDESPIAVPIITLGDLE